MYERFFIPLIFKVFTRDAVNIEKKKLISVSVNI